MRLLSLTAASFAGVQLSLQEFDPCHLQKRAVFGTRGMGWVVPPRGPGLPSVVAPRLSPALVQPLPCKARVWGVVGE